MKDTFALKKQSRVRVVYKSGYIHDFWVKNFKVDGQGNLSWEAIDLSNMPLKIAFDTADIEALWTVGSRFRLW